MISIVAIIDDKRGLGAKNRMLWHIKKDFSHFKKITMGHPIVMGRKTFESIGKSLPGRTNIVISRSGSVSSLEQALEIAKKSPGSEEIFIIGGGEIFKQAMEQNLVDKLYLTKVQGDFKAEIFFPEYESIFPKVLSTRLDLEGDYRLEFLELAK